jgi:hypothetical protein
VWGQLLCCDSSVLTRVGVRRLGFSFVSIFFEQQPHAASGNGSGCVASSVAGRAQQGLGVCELGLTDGLSGVVR